VSKPAGRQHPGGLVITLQSLPTREGETERQTSLSPKTMAIVADKRYLKPNFARRTAIYASLQSQIETGKRPSARLAQSRLAGRRLGFNRKTEEL